MRRARRAGLVLWCVAMGCSHRAVPADRLAVVQAIPPVSVTGTVMVLGADARPEIALRRADASRLSLLGPAAAELAQLAGAAVQVTGQTANAPPPDTLGLEVQSYEILEIAGARPVVGRLALNGGAYFVGTVRIGAIPSELAHALGSRVWVVGRPGDAGLIVTAYGVLSAAPLPER